MSSATNVWPAGAPTVGDTVERSRRVTADDIRRFTEISGDRNPLHYDEDAAASSRFGGIIVQGGITTAILNAVVAEDLPGPGTVLLHADWASRLPSDPAIASRAPSRSWRSAPTSRSRSCGPRSPGTTGPWR